MLALAGIVLLLYLDATLGPARQLDASVSQGVDYGLLFITGLLTGFHCVGMCGPLVFSYAAQGATEGGRAYTSHLWYGFGKTVSYTGIGALFGLLGSVVAFTPALRATAGIAAGLFLFLFGLGMLNVFRPLNRFRIKTPPALMQFLGARLRRYRHPCSIGLLNGLMVICGPLQAMYVMAAGTGSPWQGAKLLLAFGVGTLPVMLSFGALTSLVSVGLTPKLLKLSGFIVMALGVLMLNRGLVLTGSGYDAAGLWQRYAAPWLRSESMVPASEQAEDAAPRQIDTDMDAQEAAAGPLVLQKGVPVRWVIHGGEVAACTNEIVVPRLGLNLPLQKGTQVIEFTPEEAGVISWSCGMGMKTGSFVVVEPTEAKKDHAETIKR